MRVSKQSKQRLKTIAIFIADLMALVVGVISVAILSSTNTSSTVYFSGFLIYFSIIALFLFTLIIIVDCYAMFAIKTSTYHSLLMALCIMVCCLLSEDYLSLLDLSSAYGTVSNIVQYGVYTLFLAIVVILFDFSYKLGMSKKRKLSYFAVCVLSFVLFAALYRVKLHILAYCLGLAMTVELSYYTSHNPNVHCFNSHSFRPTQFITFALSGLILTNTIYSSGFVENYPFGTTSFYLFTSTLVYAFIYFSFIRKTTKRDLANAQYRAKYEQVKSGMLQAQIKPHFVFNVLLSIKNLYHSDTELGDEAIDLFSKHLRAQVEAAGADMVPFEKELDTIRVFTDLENIRQDKELNLIFDIEYSDFQIPALSLQTFIENAIKYSRISEKEDGYIRISSRCENGEILLEISDNGVGFDPSEIRDTSYGIRNSVERFRLLTGVTPEIISSPGNGTSIMIRFNKSSSEKHHENNNS